MLKKIGILTSGGDSSGMNAAIRSVVRTAIYNDIEVYGIRNGFKGLVNEEIFLMDKYSVSEKINRGGTFLGTARLPEFEQEEIRKTAINNLEKYGIEALVVIGGDGSYKGALALTKMGVNCMTIPGTIDNDIPSTEYTIGFDTALNIIIDSIDKLRDTSSSHNRCTIVEIMGRDCGNLAINSAISTGCEFIITKEIGFDKEKFLNDLKQDKINGKSHALVAITENIINSYDLAKEVKEATGFETRVTVLGHIQRGGKPSAFDRLLATNFGNHAVKLLINGEKNKCLGIKDNQIINLPLKDALNLKQERNQLFKIFDELR